MSSEEPERGGAPAQALRFALTTANSLLFPFAPHAAADGYFQLTGERVWEQSWPAADPAMLVDRSGALWIAYTDESGTWIERRGK